MSMDPALAHVSLWNTVVPYNFLILDNFKKGLSKFLPMTRPMDMIKIDLNGPYEEEAGLAAVGRLSFFHCIHFPKNAEEQFLKSVLFEGASQKEIVSWKENYDYLLRSVSFANKGKRLLLKNPANTARIETLLEMFPDAKFIHIYRNPYNVYFSTKKMRRQVLDIFALQSTTDEDLEYHVINDYIRVMKKYFDTKDKIPKKNLVEISYEDLEKNPVEQMELIYNELGIDGFEEAKPFFEQYLKRQEKYKKNVHSIGKKDLDYIKKHWAFTINAWGYKPPN